MGVTGAALTYVLLAALAEPMPPSPLPPGLPAPPAFVPPATADRPIEPLGPRPTAPDGTPYYLRAAGEIGIAFAASTAWYYHDSSLSEKDIDYDWSLESWRKRLVTFQAVRFDDNAFSINTVLHPSSGVVVYMIARGNRLGPVPSFLVTLAASTLWEFLVEYREVASINDLIITPMAGITIGEPLIRTSALLRAGGDSAGPINHVVGTILDPIGALNGALEGPSDRPDAVTDTFGLPLEYRHRLELALGPVYARLGSDTGAIRVRNEAQLASDVFVDATPALPSPGQGSRLTGPGSLTYLVFEGSLAEAQIARARLATTVSVFGQRLQRAQGPDEVRVTTAHDLFLGLGTGFEYTFRERPDTENDFMAVARLLGPLVDWGFRHRGLRLHLEAGATYDFALSHALALPAYTTNEGTAHLPRVLWEHGYYYAQGLSTHVRFMAQLGLWEAGADAVQDYLWVIKNRDRVVPPAPEPDAFDRRALRRLWLAVRFWQRLPFKLTLAGDQVVREGSLGPEHRELRELRASAMLGIGF